MLDRLPFKHVVAVDFEFEFGGHDSTAAAGRSGERPRPVCMVARELRTGETWRIWRGQFGKQPPFPIRRTSNGIDCLLRQGAPNSAASRHHLNWSQPKYVLDLFAEFRCRTSGLQKGASLVVARLDSRSESDGADANAKQGMIARILAGGPWSVDDQADILRYNESDVLLLERLLPAMLPRIDLSSACACCAKALQRKAAAAIECERHPDRYRDVGRAAASLDRNSGRTDRRD